MIPILSSSFPVTGNGLGGLADAIECRIVDEINGEYELRMKYPLTGAHFSEIAIGYIIMAQPMALAGAQPFRIYRITKPLNGVVTIYARHLSYDMSGIVITSCSASSLTAALTEIPAHAVPSCPFTLASTRTVASALSVVAPKTLWNTLGGSAGSFLDVYGGEWEFDGYTATLKTQLGTDRGVEIRYGKNLTQMENDADTSATYGGVFPFWYDDTDGLVTLTEGHIAITGSPYSRILLLDCGEYFDTKPTEQQLRDKTNAYITANAVGSPKTTWKVSFALLAQAGEYETQALLEQVQLGDTVKVKYQALGVDATARVVKTEWNVLKDQYESVTIGRVKQNLASILVGNNRETDRAIAQTKSALEIAIANSTNFIKNGTGVMRFIYNSSGDLMEIVSLDNADLSQAVSVWRWNNGGFGHSSTGYSGQYTTAITQDGQIVADFITTGTLNAARVKAGILSDSQGKNSWNLDTGPLKITDGDITITATKTFAYADYSQTDLDRIDDIRNGTTDPTDADYEKYDINGDGNISAQDRMYIVKMMQTSTDLTRTITTTIDPKANTETIKIRYQITPDMGGVTPAIDKTYFVGGPRTKLGNLEANSLASAYLIRSGNQNGIRAELKYDTGLTFYDSNGNVTGDYPNTGLKVLDETVTVNSQYFTLTDAAITANSAIFIENVYISGGTYLNVTFTVQAMAGSANVYVRQASGTIPDNTALHIKALIL